MTVGLDAATLREYLENKKGNQAFDEQRYSDAIQHYSRALSFEGDESKIITNIANIYAINKDMDQAIEIYEGTIPNLDASDKANGHYNLGTLYLQKQDYENAITHFKKALYSNPNDLDSKHNLEIAKALLKKQENDNKSNSDDDQQDKENQDRQETDPSEEPPQQRNNSQEQNKKNDSENQEKETNQNTDPSEPAENNKNSEDKKNSQTMNEKNSKEQKEKAKQMLEFLTEKEREARQMYRVQTQEAISVEKDW